MSPTIGIRKKIWKMTLNLTSTCNDDIFLNSYPLLKVNPTPSCQLELWPSASSSSTVMQLWIFRYQKGSLIRHGHVSIQLCMTSRQFMPVTTFFSFLGFGREIKSNCNCNHICQKTSSQLQLQTHASLYSGHGKWNEKLTFGKSVHSRDFFFNQNISILLVVARCCLVCFRGK